MSIYLRLSSPIYLNVYLFGLSVYLNVYLPVCPQLSSSDTKVVRRLQEVVAMDQRLLACKIISRVVMLWYKKLRLKRGAKAALEKAEVAREKASLMFAVDEYNF